MKCLVDWTHELHFYKDGEADSSGVVYVAFEGKISLPALPAKESHFYFEKDGWEEPFDAMITHVDPHAKDGKFYYKISSRSSSGLWGNSLDDFFMGINTDFKKIADELAKYGILSTEGYLFDRKYFDEQIAPHINI